MNSNDVIEPPVARMPGGVEEWGRGEGSPCPDYVRRLQADFHLPTPEQSANYNVGGAMGRDKRGTMSPVPDNLKDFLTHDQLMSLRRLENFGWHIAFVRRPVFQEVIIVLTDDRGKIGILEADGAFNMEVDIKLRE